MIQNDIVFPRTIEFTEVQTRLCPCQSIRAFRIGHGYPTGLVLSRMRIQHLPSKIVHPVEMSVPDNAMEVAAIPFPRGIMHHDDLLRLRVVQSGRGGSSICIHEEVIPETLASVSKGNGVHLGRVLSSTVPIERRRRTILTQLSHHRMCGSVSSDSQVNYRSHAMVPLGFADQLYNLRGHIALVRERILASEQGPRCRPGNPTPTSPSHAVEATGHVSDHATSS